MTGFALPAGFRVKRVWVLVGGLLAAIVLFSGATPGCSPEIKGTLSSAAPRHSSCQPASADKKDIRTGSCLTYQLLDGKGNPTDVAQLEVWQRKTNESIYMAQIRVLKPSDTAYEMMVGLGKGTDARALMITKQDGPHQYSRVAGPVALELTTKKGKTTFIGVVGWIKVNKKKYDARPVLGHASG